MTALLNEFLSSSSAWGVLLTLAAFALGTLINKVTGKAFFNPLLLGSIFVIILLSVLKISYTDYKVSAAPVSYLLLPATISLAIPLYEKWDLLKENAAAIIAGISVGTLVSLGSALALAVAMDLTREQYVTLLPKSVTTAISMDVAAELGGIAALTGAIVILTGIAGNLLAETVCKVFHITDPIAKGVGIGTSAHAVGTSKGSPDGRGRGCHERPVHRRRRCSHRRPLPYLCEFYWLSFLRQRSLAVFRCEAPFAAGLRRLFFFFQYPCHHEHAVAQSQTPCEGVGDADAEALWQLKSPAKAGLLS